MRAIPLLLLLLQGGLLLGGGAMAARPAYRWGLRCYSQARARTEWTHYRNGSRPRDTPRRPALWLTIPRRGFSDMVLADDSTDNLARHACLVPGSPPVILGHRDTHFRALKGIAVNDSIEIEQLDGRRVSYRVSEVEILPVDRANQRLHEHRDPTSLVLMTCHPFQYIGPAPNRLLVWATPTTSRRTASNAALAVPGQSLTETACATGVSRDDNS